MSQQNHNPYFSQALAAPLDNDWAARREVAAAIRQLSEKLLTKKVDVTLLHAMADVLRQQVETLDSGQHIQGRGVHRGAELDKPDLEQVLKNVAVIDYEISPLSGQSNAIAPPMHVWFDGDRVRASATLGWQYEGPPECVHGGFVAAMFDQLLGLGQSLVETPGVTGTLTVKYLNKTPLHQPLRMEGWVDRVEGRKNILCAEIWAEDIKTASCEAIFISIDHSAWNIS